VFQPNAITKRFPNAPVFSFFGDQEPGFVKSHQACPLSKFLNSSRSILLNQFENPEGVLALIATQHQPLCLYNLRERLLHQNRNRRRSLLLTHVTAIAGSILNHGFRAGTGFELFRISDSGVSVAGLPLKMTRFGFAASVPTSSFA